MPCPAEISARAEAALAERAKRIQRIEVAGQFYWVKSEERLTMRMRLQKGDAHNAFEAERQAMHTLSQAGAPVPPVVAEGPDYFVMPDRGQSLRRLLRDTSLEPSARLPAFRAAAKGLARFHENGLSHGRPSIKDICWDGQRVTFLDLERYAPKRNTRNGHAQDLVILLFSAFADAGRPCAETDALAESYRAVDRADIWADAQRLCRRLAWISPLTWPVRQIRRSPEFLAIPMTLRAFGA